MVRFTLLAVVLAACCAAAPAQAELLPVDVQGAATTIGQAPGAAVTTARDTTAAVTRPARAAVMRAPADTAGSAPAAAPTVRAAAGLAEPAAEYTTAAAGTAQGDAPVAASAPVQGGKPARLGSGDPETFGQGRSARFGRGESASLGGERRPGAAPLTAGSGAFNAAVPAGRAAVGGLRGTPASAAEGPSPAPQPGPSAGGGAASSSGAGSVPFGGLALLAAAVCLAAPRLRRRLLIRPARWRPVAFVSLLERPG